MMTPEQEKAVERAREILDYALTPHLSADQLRGHISDARALIAQPTTGAEVPERCYSEDEVRDYMRRLIGKDSIRVWAALRGLKSQQVDAFLRGARPLEPKVAASLDLVRVPFYRHPSRALANPSAGAEGQ